MTDSTGNTRLTQELRKLIDDEGQISVEDYMSRCLASYYSDQDPLGKDGDFITSPEISQIFGELIGLWACEVWSMMGRPSDFKLIELGPGRGTLMSDALRACKMVPGFLDAVSVHMVEMNVTLQKQQRLSLAPFSVSLTHYDSVDTIPDGPAVLIANEFFDALPVRQFAYQKGAWFERGVGYSDSFCFSVMDKTADDTLCETFSSLCDYEPVDGDIFEYRRQCLKIIEQIAKRDSICALVIDYGHEVSGFGDTLQAVRSHTFSDIFEHMGEVDLTTQIDFNQIKRFSENFGLNCFGPMTQGQFLLMLGLEQRLKQLLTSATDEQSHQLKTGAIRLVAPDQMGALFKVMCLTSAGISKPPPFT